MIDYETLTVMPGKVQKYAEEDGKFLDIGASIAERAHGTRMPDVLSRLAVLVLQPDAIARRKVAACLSLLRQRGYRLLLTKHLTLTTPMFTEIWRFQSNVFTPDSVAIRHCVYTYGPSLMLLLEDVRPSAEYPASSRLALLKGSPNPAERHEDNLRTALGAINRIFGLVHCPDEPIDILRELAIMLPETALGNVHEQLRAALERNVEHDGRTETDQVYREIREHDFNQERALRRLLTRTTSSERSGSVCSQSVQTLIAEAALPGNALDWFKFSDRLRELDIDPRTWDPLIVASDLVRNSAPGGAKLIPSFTELSRTESLGKPAFHRP